MNLSFVHFRRACYVILAHKVFTCVVGIVKHRTIAKTGVIFFPTVLSTQLLPGLRSDERLPCSMRHGIKVRLRSHLTYLRLYTLARFLYTGTHR